MKIKIVNIAILLVTLLGTLFALSQMPDEVPVHFNIHGVADRWGSKYELLIMIPFMLIMQVVWYACDYFYRKREKYALEEKEKAEAIANIKVLKITFTAISVLFALLNGITLYMSYSQLEGVTAAEIDIMKAVSILMGIFFILLGNFMPKAKKNHLVGFRFPWTMYNDVTWAKCNRMSGVAGVICGIVVCALGIILEGIWAITAMLISLGIFCVVSLAYAYKIYRDEKRKETE